MSKSKTPKKKVKTIKPDAKKSTTTSRKSTSNSKGAEAPAQLPFSKMNYILLLVGVGIIGLGFILMSMDDFIDANEFSISLYIAPIVVVAGFLEIIYAIMYRPKSEPETTVERF